MTTTHDMTPLALNGAGLGERERTAKNEQPED